VEKKLQARLFTFADAVWIRYVTGRNVEQLLLWSSGYWAREWLCAHYTTVLDQSNATLQGKGGRILNNVYVGESITHRTCVRQYSDKSTF